MVGKVRRKGVRLSMIGTEEMGAGRTLSVVRKVRR